MKDCEEVLTNLHALLEGDLGSPLCQILKEHLKQCEGCRRHFEEMAELINLCRSFPEEPTSEAFKEKVKALLVKKLGRP